MDFERLAARFATPLVYWVALLGLCAAYVQVRRSITKAAERYRHMTARGTKDDRARARSASPPTQCRRPPRVARRNLVALRLVVS